MDEVNVRGFRGLRVWHAAMKLVDDIYKASDPLPKCEDYALKGQLRRSACSVPSNIAEGTARGTKKDYLSFLRIAAGSLRELETQLEICVRVGYLSPNQYELLRKDVEVIARMLTALMSSVRKTA